eukprot:scaffold27339_cov28-Tisochrysis_lutea.AAC.5
MVLGVGLASRVLARCNSLNREDLVSRLGRREVHPPRDGQCFRIEQLADEGELRGRFRRKHSGKVRCGGGRGSRSASEAAVVAQ